MEAPQRNTSSPIELIFAADVSLSFMKTCLHLIDWSKSTREADTPRGLCLCRRECVASHRLPSNCSKSCCHQSAFLLSCYCK